MMQPALFATRRPGEERQELPDRVLQKLIADGYIDAATGATRRARPAKCRKCGAWVVRGLDADMCARAVDCDYRPLTAAGEALALLAGLATYELVISAGRPEFDRRDHWSIQGAPAGTGRADILVVHRCHEALPLPRGPSRLPAPPQQQDLPDAPPF